MAVQYSVSSIGHSLHMTTRKEERGKKKKRRKKKKG
jgi:hypothetical protein